MRGRVAVVLVGIVALAAAGCGKKQQPASGGGMTTSTPAAFEIAKQPPGEVVGGKVVVEMKDLKFIPENLTVPAGTTAIWANLDNVAHTVTKRRGPGPSFNSGPIDPGATFQQVLTKEGRIKVIDRARPSMEMNIVVEPE
jgi:plastocyanin